MVLKVRGAATVRPLRGAALVAQRLGYHVSISSATPSVSADGAMAIVSRRHDGVTLSEKSLTPPTLVWWGTRSPHLAWVMMGHSARVFKTTTWLIAINARSGTWLVEQRLKREATRATATNSARPTE